jgi:hypothetical protein
MQNERICHEQKKKEKPEYDWRRLKIEFLLSKYSAVRDWAKHTHSNLPATNNSSFINHVAGWKEEKEEMLDMKNQLTIDLIVKKHAKINAKMYEILLGKMVAVISAAEYMEAGDIKQLWHMVRVECGLVTNIAKNENTNNNFDFSALRTAMTERVKDKLKDDNNSRNTKRRGNKPLPNHSRSAKL